MLPRVGLSLMLGPSRGELGPFDLEEKTRAIDRYPHDVTLVLALSRIKVPALESQACARRGTRTPTPLRAADFESAASAYSAIRARWQRSGVTVDSAPNGWITFDDDPVAEG
jgi:hypothetical protein